MSLHVKKKAWITWERQPRNKSMAKLFDADYMEILSHKKGLKRYTECISRTFEVLRKKKFEVVFVQNPSIVLALTGVLFKVLFRYKLVIDAHNAGVRPKEGRNELLQIANRMILRTADCVIVTNEPLKAFLTQKKITSMVVSDPLPDLIAPKKPSFTNFIFVICSWAEDEPIKEYLDTANQCSDFNFVFSGNYKKYFSESDMQNLPDNVILPGFVDEDEYVGLLTYAEMILDLTERDDCLVCGAYESISVSQKVILSNTRVNKSLFGSAAFYTKNNSNDLINTIREASTVNLNEEINKFKDQYGQSMMQAKEELEAKLL